VSVCRYYGKGKEESDVNADGPNIEFDGFGLFLWALSEYLGQGGDVALLDTYWTTIRDQVGNVLAGLTEGATGLIKADSSIWEVHWNGKQKRYTYTTLTAAHGLCLAAALARSRGETTVADAWAAAGLALRDALRTRSVDGGKVLASSYEELQAGAGYHDVASVEAVAFRLFKADGAVAAATLASFDAALKVASGRGYFRNDDGGWYDAQEWVWADLRVASAQRRAGATAAADRLVGWIGAQALANYGMVAELHHPTTGDYEGEVPMVGYGAGAYQVALLDREAPQSTAAVCGGWETP
jgi:GH15 family glucan-1,4-alpha-glucosidase